MISEQTIQHAALLLGEAAKPAQVILFGSYARGDAREDSQVLRPDLISTQGLNWVHLAAGRGRVGCC